MPKITTVTLTPTESELLCEWADAYEPAEPGKGGRSAVAREVLGMNEKEAYPFFRGDGPLGVLKFRRLLDHLAVNDPGRLALLNTLGQPLTRRMCHDARARANRPPAPNAPRGAVTVAVPG